MLAIAMVLGESVTALAAEPGTAIIYEAGQPEDYDGTPDEEGCQDVDISGGDEADVSANIPEEVPGETDETGEKDGKFPGLSDDSVLSADYIADKSLLSEHADEWSNAAEGRDYVAGEIIVEAESEEAAKTYAEAFNGTLTDYFHGVAVIELNADDTLPEASVYDAVLASSVKENNLPAAWPNYYRYADDTGDYNDPYLLNASPSCQWHHGAIQSQLAWNAGYRGQGVKVAVLDTGVNVNHEELLNINTCDIGLGKDDTDGHGTHICALIGASLNNGKGGAGVAPECTLYSIKIANKVSDKDEATVTSLIKGVYKAVAEKVDIMNVSFGGTNYVPLEEEAFQTAYEEGIAVFCAAGNGYTNTSHYPAAYKSTISVAALEAGMTKAPFSNYDASVRYSAPGVEICSAEAKNTNTYGFRSGTSQASAITAGAAALIWPTINGTGKYTGKAKVDNLLKKMDSSCNKVNGTNLGKGCINLAKALSLTTSDAAPKKPVIETKSGTYKDTSVTVVISGIDIGCTAYYSTDGKPVTFKNGMLSANAIAYNGPFELSGKGSFTIYAIAVKNANQMASGSVSAKYTLRPEVSGIRIESLTGAAYLTQGTGLSLKAVQTPNYAVKKTVKWSVDAPKESGVTVSSSGRVSAGKKAVPGTYTVKATLPNGLSAPFQITVKEASASQITSFTVKNKNVTVTAGQVFTVRDIVVKKKDKSAAGASDINWYTADESIADVVGNTDTTIQVKGVSFGKTSITGVAADGSGKTVTLKVNVLQPVTGIYLNNALPGDYDYMLACGKTIKPEITVAPANASNKKLKWSVQPAGMGVSVKDGVIKADNKAATGTYTITATAADGSGVSTSFKVLVKTRSTTGISVDRTTVDLFRVNNGFGSSTGTTISVWSESNYLWDITANSAPGLVTATKKGDSIYIQSTGKAIGTATITLSTLDGTNKKVSIKVNIKNPASNLMISPESGRCAYVARGTSMQMVATVTNGYGKVTANAGKFYWSSSNPGAVKVDQNGRVTGVSGEEGPVTITATAMDGSGLRAEYTVYSCDRVSAITIDSENVRTVNVGDSFTKDVSETASSDGVCSYMIDIKCNKPGLTAEYDDKEHKIRFTCNKEGTYTVTISCMDGSPVKLTYKVIVE